MRKFRGFQLMRLVRAINEQSKDSIERPYTYEVEHFEKVSDGSPKTDYYSIHKIDSHVGKFMRMTEEDGNSQFAMQSGSNDWVQLTSEEFNEWLVKYKE